MGLTLEQKKAVVTDVAAVAQGAHSVVAAEYRGLSVAKMMELRVQARNEGVHVRVVRNTLARRAFENTDFDCMRDSLTGPLVLAFSQEEPGAAARVMGSFAKSNDQLKIRLVAVGGKLLAPSELSRLAALPTRDEAIAQLMAVMKAPITKLARTLREPQAKLARTVAAIRDQKQTA